MILFHLFEKYLLIGNRFDMYGELTKVFAHPFLQARRISLPGDVSVVLEKNAIGRNSEENSEGRLFNSFI